MTEQIDPRTEFLKQAMSRRGFMSAVGATGAAAALAACGTSSEDSSSEASGTGEQTSGENVVWANWTAYLDRKKGKYPTLEVFQKESGYTVDYKEDIDDNNLPRMYWFGLEPMVPDHPKESLKLALEGKIPALPEFVARRMVSGEVTVNVNRPRAKKSLSDWQWTIQKVAKRFSVY